MSCSRTQRSDDGEARTHCLSVSSQALYHLATALHVLAYDEVHVVNLVNENKTCVIQNVSQFEQEILLHTLQTTPRHREEEPQNIYSNNTSVRQY